jgi:hypothetical protein
MFVVCSVNFPSAVCMRIQGQDALQYAFYRKPDLLWQNYVVFLHVVDKDI